MMKQSLLSLCLFVAIIQGDPINEVKTSQDEKVGLKGIKCDKSLFSKHDIQTIIESTAESIGIYKSINDTIQSEAVPVRNRYLHIIQSFKIWLEDRPQHLKHILQDISVKQKYVAKRLSEIKDGLKNYPQIVALFEEKVENAKKLVKKLIHLKELCELNCGPQDVSLRRSLPSESEYYCGTIDEVQNITKTQLVKIAFEYTLKIRTVISKADMVYSREIHNIFNNVSDVAIKEFAITMYTILTLQDRYHHFINDLNEFYPDVWLFMLKNVNIQIDSTLLKLEETLHILEGYCKKCASNHKQISIIDRQQINDDVHDNIIQSLLKIKMIEINHNIEKELTDIFHELNEKLENGYLESFLISNLAPIQKEIEELTNEEVEHFYDLMKLKIDKDLIMKLIENTKKLVNAATRETRAIIAVVKDIVPS